jgi:hypothetical protein
MAKCLLRRRRRRDVPWCTYLCCGLCILSGTAPHVNRVWQAAGCILDLCRILEHFALLWYMVAENCCCAHLSLYEDPTRPLSGEWLYIFCWPMLILSILQAVRSSELTSGANLGRSTNRANAIVRRLCHFAASFSSPPLCLPSDCNTCLKSPPKAV